MNIFVIRNQISSNNFAREPTIQSIGEEEINPNTVRKKIDFATDLERIPIRVSNPVVNDEFFLK